jgi:hypothetical protein
MSFPAAQALVSEYMRQEYRNAKFYTYDKYRKTVILGRGITTRTTGKSTMTASELRAKFVGSSGQPDEYLAGKVKKNTEGRNK